MVADWTAAAITGAVGVAGIVGTYLGTRSQIKGQVELARSERQQRRREESYMELLVLVAEADDWAYDLMQNFAGVGTNKPYPARPRIYVRTISSQGVLSVYWSGRLRQLIADLQAQINAATEAWARSQAARANQESTGARQPQSQLPVEKFLQAKERISQIADMIRNQVSDELSDKHSGEADANVRP